MMTYRELAEKLAEHGLHLGSIVMPSQNIIALVVTTAPPDDSEQKAIRIRFWEDLDIGTQCHRVVNEVDYDHWGSIGRTVSDEEIAKCAQSAKDKLLA